MKPITNSLAVQPRSNTLGSRIAWLIFFSAPLAVLVTAAALTPNPLGHGTHTQLGLPPCGFLVLSGIQCPGCGLTTCFAYMIRGQVVGAALANPFGIPLFLVTLASIPVSAVGFVRGWRVIDTLERLHFEKIAIGLSICSLLVWGIRAAVQITGG